MSYGDYAVEQIGWTPFYESHGYGLELENDNVDGYSVEVDYDDNLSDLLWEYIDDAYEVYTFNVYMDDDEHNEVVKALLNNLDEGGLNYDTVKLVESQLKKHGVEPDKQGEMKILALNNPKTVGVICYGSQTVEIDVTFLTNGGGNHFQLFDARRTIDEDNPLTPLQVSSKLGGDHVAITRAINWDNSVKFSEVQDEDELYRCGVLREDDY